MELKEIICTICKIFISMGDSLTDRCLVCVRHDVASKNIIVNLDKACERRKPFQPMKSNQR